MSERMRMKYRGIRDKASAKGILMQIFLSILTNLLNCASKLGLARLTEKGTLGLSSGFRIYFKSNLKNPRESIHLFNLRLLVRKKCKNKLTCLKLGQTF